MFFITLCFLVDVAISSLVGIMHEEFGDNFINQLHIFINAEETAKASYCSKSVEIFKEMYEFLSILYGLVFFSCIGYFTAVIQKITVVRLKDNVQPAYGHILLECAIVVASGIYIVMNASNPSNTLISDTCKQHINLSTVESR